MSDLICCLCREDDVAADGLAHGMCALCWGSYARDVWRDYLHDENHQPKLDFENFKARLGQPNGVAWLNHWPKRG